MKHFLFGLALSLSTTAFADWNGHWTGTGTAWDSEGWSGQCTTLTVDVTKTDTQFSIRNGFWQCGEKTTHWSPLDFRIGDFGNLWYGKFMVGHISDNGLGMRLPEESGLLGGHAVGYYSVKKTGENSFLFKERLTRGAYSLYIRAVMSSAE